MRSGVRFGAKLTQTRCRDLREQGRRGGGEEDRDEETRWKKASGGDQGHLKVSIVQGLAPTPPSSDGLKQKVGMDNNRNGSRSRGAKSQIFVHAQSKLLVDAVSQVSTG